MKIIDLIQGSFLWLEWRKSILTASDASCIMDCNPYCDAVELRLRKLGLLPDIECTEAMRRGHDMEPIARDCFHKLNSNIKFTPAVVESSEYPFLGASLDGLCQQYDKLTAFEIGGVNTFKRHDYILEIKCGVKSHEMAKDGKIPNYYFTQIQHQLICTRAEKCFYFSYQSDDDHVTIEVFPDADFEAHYVPIAEQFWMDLLFKNPEIFKEKT